MDPLAAGCPNMTWLLVSTPGRSSPPWEPLRRWGSEKLALRLPMDWRPDTLPVMECDLSQHGLSGPCGQAPA